MYPDERLGIQVGKVHPRMKAGTSMLRNKVDGEGGNYGDCQYQRENVREIMKICVSFIFRKQIEIVIRRKQPYVFQKLIRF